jgi:NTP pyrophosphatase (non-canonical NTP hydrolase)
MIMQGKEYQNLAMRTNDRKGTDRVINALTKSIINSCEIVNSDSKETTKDLGGIFNACLGLSGEVGELNDMIKKWIFHEKPFDEEHTKKELGDVMWYVAMMCESFGWDLDEIMQMNVDKLKARYPQGFSVERANNRKEGDV